jgi:hypothetical protein
LTWKIARERGEHRRVVDGATASLGRLVALLDDQPVLRVTVELRGDERPEAVQPFALEPNRQAAVALLLDQLVRAGVPDLDAAGAVLAGRDLSLEGRVLERMVLDVHGEVALARRERDPLRHGPARERTVSLEPEVVVESSRVVALDDEDRRGGRRAAAPERLGSLPPIALAVVVVETRHVPNDARVSGHVKRERTQAALICRPGGLALGAGESRPRVR